MVRMVARLALVGDENPGHPSHREINAVCGMLGDDVETRWVPTDAVRQADLAEFDGIWLVPGSPYMDDEAALAVVRYAREHDVPFLGTCGGLQYAVLEFFRNVIGDLGAGHAEVDGPGSSNVVVPLACSLRGEERDVRPVPGTRFDVLVGGRTMAGMHYCGYGPDPDRLAELVAHGVVVEAYAEDAGAEVLELPWLGFFMVSLFQPQVGALAGRPLHPLLAEFVRCARAYSGRRSSGPAGRVTIDG